jgi:hypothetical protein
LAWIFMSFTFDYKITFLMSNVALNPMLILEFVMLYGNNISSVKETAFFKSYGSFFAIDHKHGILERSFLFFVLMIFSMMLSCFILEFKSQDKEKIHRFFAKRIQDPKYSKGWKFLFYFLKYIHTFALLILAIYGGKNLNNLKNMGFMLFFCFYTAYESLYRKTCGLLITFIAIFIVG